MKTMPVAALVCLMACVIGNTNPAQAQTATSNMSVTLTVQAACTIVANPLDFGSVGVITAAVDAASSLVVQCTNGLPYTVTLGTGTAGTFGARLLSNGTATVLYNLYTEAGRTTVWGDGTAGTGAVGGTGSGVSQEIPVFGRVPVQPSPAAGTYTDVVLATITY